MEKNGTERIHQVREGGGTVSDPVNTVLHLQFQNETS